MVKGIVFGELVFLVVVVWYGCVGYVGVVLDYFFFGYDYWIIDEFYCQGISGVFESLGLWSGVFVWVGWFGLII